MSNDSSLEAQYREIKELLNVPLFNEWSSIKDQVIRLLHNIPEIESFVKRKNVENPECKILTYDRPYLENDLNKWEVFEKMGGYETPLQLCIRNIMKNIHSNITIKLSCAKNLVEFLLKGGSNPNVDYPNQEGSTILNIYFALYPKLSMFQVTSASSLRDKNVENLNIYKTLLSLLLEYGADPHISLYKPNGWKEQNMKRGLYHFWSDWERKQFDEEHRLYNQLREGEVLGNFLVILDIRIEKPSLVQEAFTLVKLKEKTEKETKSALHKLTFKGKLNPDTEGNILKYLSMKVPPTRGIVKTKKSPPRMTSNSTRKANNSPKR